MSPEDLADAEDVLKFHYRRAQIWYNNFGNFIGRVNGIDDKQRSDLKIVNDLTVFLRGIFEWYYEP